MLRTAVLACGALLLLAGMVIALASDALAGLGPAGLGTVLLRAIVLARRGSQRIEDRAPGPNRQPTGELFQEPGSDRPVEAYFQPATGTRR